MRSSSIRRHATTAAAANDDDDKGKIKSGWRIHSVEKDPLKILSEDETHTYL
jgi:hypothetical protein